MELRLDHVSKSYQETSILKTLNIHINNHKAIAIIGPSGAGKSTLLRLLSKIEEPTHGEIFVNQHQLSQVSTMDYYKQIGFVFQAHALFPHLSVLRNITLILEKVHHYDKEEALKVSLGLLRKFDLEEQAHQKSSSLSGGESQRASIVRSLAIKPEVLFFDEPTSSLDPVLKQEVLKTILKLKNEATDFVIVTHEILFAKKAVDYIIFMQDGEIVEHGEVSILNHPKTDALKGFLENVFMS